MLLEKALVDFLFLCLDDFLDDVISLPTPKSPFQILTIPFFLIPLSKNPYFLLHKTGYLQHIKPLLLQSLLPPLDHVVYGLLRVHVILNLRVQFFILETRKQIEFLQNTSPFIDE